jgi:hypothetical protein
VSKTHYVNLAACCVWVPHTHDCEGHAAEQGAQLKQNV